MLGFTTGGSAMSRGNTSISVSVKDGEEGDGIPEQPGDEGTSFHLHLGASHAPWTPYFDALAKGSGLGSLFRRLVPGEMAGRNAGNRL